MMLMRGWFHVKRYVYEEFLKEVIEPYILQVHEYGQVMDITVEDLPQALYAQFNRMLDTREMEAYEKQGESKKVTKATATKS
jgi:hypothetical protein